MLFAVKRDERLGSLRKYVKHYERQREWQKKMDNSLINQRHFVRFAKQFIRADLVNNE